MLNAYIVTCAGQRLTVIATGAADAIARALPIFGNGCAISARRAAA